MCYNSKHNVIYLCIRRKIISKLKKDYNPNGELRVYRLDEYGNEWFYYEDQETNLTLRAITIEEKDLEKVQQINTEFSKDVLKEEVSKIDRSKTTNCDYDMWIVENRVGKLIGAIDVYCDGLGILEVSYYFKNDTMLKSYETMLKKALNNLGRYMEIGIDHLTSKIIEPLYIAS